MRIVLIAACGRKKENVPQEAGKLYKSARIRYFYRKSKELGIPFYILSAKYGLVNSEKVIEPYDEVMTKEKCNRLYNQIKQVIEKFDVIIFFKGGAKKEYRECIEEVAKDSGKKLISFGYGNVGDIGKLEELINGLSIISTFL